MSVTLHICLTILWFNTMQADPKSKHVFNPTTQWDIWNIPTFAENFPFFAVVSTRLDGPTISVEGTMIEMELAFT